MMRRFRFQAFGGGGHAWSITFVEKLRTLQFQIWDFHFSLGGRLGSHLIYPETSQMKYCQVHMAAWPANAFDPRDADTKEFKGAISAATRIDVK